MINLQDTVGCHVHYSYVRNSIVLTFDIITIFKMVFYTVLYKNTD